MFFNVSREMLGRRGKFYDVMMMYWTQIGQQLTISAYSPTQFLHVEKLASTKKVQRQNVLARMFKSRKCRQKQLQREPRINVAPQEI